jgi:DNA-binding transcriptional regulator YhcF (GntR family)
MATQQPAQTTSLQDEIKRLEQQLAEKTALLNKQQEEKINSLINAFIADVEKNGFSKVEVKKLVIEKLTRKHKARK